MPPTFCKGSVETNLLSHLLLTKTCRYRHQYSYTMAGFIFSHSDALALQVSLAMSP
ncbi:MAG: hypothetical protein AVDCRST_MAG96-608 [uncultured Segetibacter sp.]|uniref:Uncharacterized protein n=1 Tax=uncultured Segetibacter sp. TaxID=481133 RepID=A0A6J4RJJ0_9BACT|nr:MAG: hypothetical protein AVDCRST_MAG96-608 [uncultured Segetibacter sp.]